MKQNANKPDNLFFIQIGDFKTPPGYLKLLIMRSFKKIKRPDLGFFPGLEGLNCYARKQRAFHYRLGKPSSVSVRKFSEAGDDVAHLIDNLADQVNHSIILEGSGKGILWLWNSSGIMG